MTAALRCRSCGCLSSEDGRDCLGRLGRGSVICDCHYGSTRFLPPNEVGPHLLDQVRQFRDEHGDLANALADDLRDALRLACEQLDERDAEIARLSAELANAAELVDAVRRNLNAAGDELDHASSTTPKGRFYPGIPPMLDGEDHDHYSNRLIGVYGPESYPYDHVRNRQCALGWHGECSEKGVTDASARRCQCPCHSVEQSRRLELA